MYAVGSPEKRTASKSPLARPYKCVTEDHRGYEPRSGCFFSSARFLFCFMTKVICQPERGGPYKHVCERWYTREVLCLKGGLRPNHGPLRGYLGLPLTLGTASRRWHRGPMQVQGPLRRTTILRRIPGTTDDDGVSATPLSPLHRFPHRFHRHSSRYPRQSEPHAELRGKGLRMKPSSALQQLCWGGGCRGMRPCARRLGRGRAITRMCPRVDQGKAAQGNESLSSDRMELIWAPN